MQKQELYNKIRTRINELVPNYKKQINHEFGCSCDRCGEIMSKVLIIDKEPHLEHILEAIGKNSVDGVSFNITDNKIYYKIFTPMTSETGEFDYNLSLSLENQSLETLEALDKLLN